MTALEQYKLLETTGLWRESPEEQRKDVVVSFGEATLVVSSPAGVALTHWSLAALVRVNPHEFPAVFTPDDDGFETLELDDETMIHALETVIETVAKRAPQPWRLRRYILVLSLFGVIGLGLFWFPGALQRHTLSVVPEVTRHQIGDALLVEVERLTGSACDAAGGDLALNRMRMRLSPETRALAILPLGSLQSTHLPGGHILLGQALLDAQDDPEVVAGYVLAEEIRMNSADPLEALLTHAGTIAAFQLMTSGQLPQDSLSQYAEHLLISQPKDLTAEILVARFARADLSIAGYAVSVDRPELIAVDPHPDGSSQPVMGDGDWITLLQICAN